MKLIQILILLLVSFAIYFNALFGDFVYDDKDQIVYNPWIRDIRNIPTIFSTSVWSFQPALSISNYYRPLMHVVYMLNYHVFGLKPWGFHLINILFHCGASVLVFLIVRRFLTEQSATKSSVYLSSPFIAAMLFVSHPIHTEAVTWIAGLPDVAFTFFYLLSFYVYILYRDGDQRGYLLSILSFSAATLFKEPALTLPIMLIAYDYLFKKSDDTKHTGIPRIKRYIPFGALAGAYLLVRYYALSSFVPKESYAHLRTYQFIINAFPLFSEYLKSLLWPFDLNFWHTFHPISSLFETKGIISIVVTVIFFSVVVAANRRNKKIVFSLLLVVLPLLPVFYIKAIGGKPFAERYLYLPSVGYVLLLGIFLSRIKEKMPRAAKSITILFIIIVGLYTVGTITRNNVWKDDFTLWSETAKKSPDSAVAHNILGAAYRSQGLLDRAMAECQTALRLDPALAEAHNNLGAAYRSQGLWDRAVAEYQTALRLKPYLAEAHYNLGIAYAAQGLLDKAIAEFQTASRLKPYLAEAHYNLGAAYLSKGGLADMAKAEIQTALRLKPAFAEAHYSLALIYLNAGNADLARREVEVVLNIRPDLDKARQLLNEINSRQQSGTLKKRTFQ